MLSVQSQPDSLDISLSLSSSVHSVIIDTDNYDRLTPTPTPRPIYSSDFKPKCSTHKQFHFPVLLLSNIRGGFTTKLDELQQILDYNNVDICVLTETWLHDGIDSMMLELLGYTLFRLDRRDGRQGVELLCM